MNKPLLILLACLASLSGVFAAEEAVKKDPVANTLTETLSLGTQTLTVPATGTLDWASGATITGADFMRASLGVTIGTHVQAWDTDLDAWALVTPSANGASLVGADYATMRDLLDLEIGTNVQAFSLNLSAIAGLTSAADKLAYFTGSGAAAVTDFTATARDLLNDSTVAAMRATLAAARTDGANTFAGVQTISDTTNATSTTTGASKNAGGGSVEKDFHVGGVIYGKHLLPGRLVGYEMYNDPGDTANDITVKVGECVAAITAPNTTSSGFIRGGGQTKRIDATWTGGHTGGGLDSGSIGNGSYHVHVIGGDPTVTNPDVIFSLSHDEHAPVTMTIASPCVATWADLQGRGHGLVAGSPIKFFVATGNLPTGVVAGTQYYVIATGLTATTFQFSATVGGAAVNSSGLQFGIQYVFAGPDLTLPGSSYVYYRRIGSVVRAGGANLQFIQRGDDFRLVTPVLDISTTTLASGSRTTFTLASVPVGLPVQAHMRFVGSHATAGNAAIVTSLDETDAAPSNSASPLTSVYVTTNSASNPISQTIWTNFSGQICARATAGSFTLRGLVLGWTDTRGRDRF